MDESYNTSNSVSYEEETINNFPSEEPWDGYDDFDWGSYDPE